MCMSTANGGEIRTGFASVSPIAHLAQRARMPSAGGGRSAATLRRGSVTGRVGRSNAGECFSPPSLFFAVTMNDVQYMGQVQFSKEAVS